MKDLFLFERIYIESAIREHPQTLGILERVGDKPVTIIPSLLDIDLTATTAAYLILAEKNSPFLHKCPGTPHYLCCDYFVLESGYNCPFDCAYCFLKFYLNHRHYIHYINTDSLFQELDEQSRRLTPGRYLRVGTGEFIDSLALDALIRFSGQVVTQISRWPNIIFEFKTKSVEIENLLSVQAPATQNVVVGFSLNPSRVIERYEKDTPSLDERLTAARALQNVGYLIALHFDPIIYYSDWENDYVALVRRIFEFLKPDRIVWISLGILRFHPQLRRYWMDRKMPQSLTAGEYIQGKDGKERLARPLREKIYRRMIRELRAVEPTLFIYLCMESRAVWRRLFVNAPQSMDEITRGFIHRYQTVTQSKSL